MTTPSDDILISVYENRYASYHFFCAFYFTAASFWLGSFTAVAAFIYQHKVIDRHPQFARLIRVLLVGWPTLMVLLVLIVCPFVFLAVGKFIAIQEALELPNEHITRGGMLIVLWTYSLIVSLTTVWVGIAVAKELSHKPESS